MKLYRCWLPQDVFFFVMWLYLYAEFTPTCGPERALVPDPEECYRHDNAVDRKGGLVSHTSWIWVKVAPRRKPVHLKFHFQPLVTERRLAAVVV